MPSAKVFRLLVCDVASLGNLVSGQRSGLTLKVSKVKATTLPPKRLELITQ
jgi:hypothetical protein